VPRDLSTSAVDDGKGTIQHIPRLPETGKRTDRTAKGVRLPYLPGLDGLRALAVIAVLLYHAELYWIPGGFLGVEIFFVISGYLITALLLAEWQQRGRLDLPGFWLRRARRLLPALYLLLAVTLALSVVFLPGEVAGLRSDALAAFGYVTNWYLIFNHESYFEAVGRPSLLQHLWSLAVEEQFYLLWPPLFVLGMTLVRWRFRRALFAALLVGAAASALLMALLYRPDLDPSRVYYGTDTRATGLLVGAALAFVWTPKPSRRETGWSIPLLLDIVGLAALGGLVWFCHWLDQYQPFLFRGGLALVALLTGVVIMVTVHPRARLLGAGLLGRGPLRWLGLRSYGIYLWHWPVFMVTRPDLDVPISGVPLLILRLAATLVIADLSYRYVETPIRTGALGRAWKSLREAQGAQRWRLGVRWATVLGMGTALSVALGVAVIHAQPPPPPSYLAVESIHTDAPTTPTSDAEGSTPASQTSDTDAVTSKTPPDTADSETAQPEAAEEDEKTTSSNPLVAGRVTFIGDSVMIGTYGELKRAIGEPAMYADVGMQAAGVIEIVQKHRAAGDLGDTVVIHIGSNGVFNEEQFDETMQMLKDARKVVVVNVKAPRPWEQPNNEMLAEGVQRYPNAVLVDWHAASAGRPELFVEDGIHLQPEGQRLYADMIAAQLPDDVRSGAS